MFIQTEDTPNPSVIKFLPGREVLASGTREFRSESDAMASPLAVDLFDIPGVTRVFYGTDFVTVTKDDDSEWPHLKAPILAAIMDHFTSGVALFSNTTAEAVNETVYEGETAAIVAEIKDLLDSKVRPAVAQDGGDIVFHDFREGVVYLQMQGSCSGCPSSTATLKMGIENLLKHYVPEVVEVQAVQ